MRDAGSDRDGADLDIAELDQPAFFASIVVAAAGKDGHGRDDSADRARSEAVPA